MPRLNAAATPRGRGCPTTMTSGYLAARRATVSSVDPSSTTITSSGRRLCWRRESRHAGRNRAPFKVGMTTQTAVIGSPGSDQVIDELIERFFPWPQFDTNSCARDVSQNRVRWTARGQRVSPKVLLRAHGNDSRPRAGPLDRLSREIETRAATRVREVINPVDWAV